MWNRITGLFGRNDDGFAADEGIIVVKRSKIKKQRNARHGRPRGR
jgi:hypothetical protein